MKRRHEIVAASPGMPAELGTEVCEALDRQTCEHCGAFIEAGHEMIVSLAPELWPPGLPGLRSEGWERWFCSAKCCFLAGAEHGAELAKTQPATSPAAEKGNEPK